MRPLALLAAAAALPLAAQETATPHEIAWQTDFAAARAQAHKEHKPLCVLFRCER